MNNTQKIVHILLTPNKNAIFAVDYSYDIKMKRFILYIIMTVTMLPHLCAQQFVIMHTNDTHSMIDPDFDGNGGILRRKAIIDSIRNASPENILIDAGDVVQGTPYFSLFKGEPEYALMDSLGYDIMILGNHEFDNGMEDIAKNYRFLKAAKISTNYDLTDTPLDGLFEPYIIRNFGGKKVAFLGINLDPVGMIAAANSEGIVYHDPYVYSDSIAGLLKESGEADAVVVVSHIGYKYTRGKENDVELIGKSRNIDLLIGGHSHTAINPGQKNSPEWDIPNADGKLITVCQTGGSGKTLGVIDVCFDDEGKLKAKSHLIQVDSRYDNRIDTTLAKYIAPFKHIVDSMMNNVVIVSDVELPNRRSAQTMNWIADLAYSLGSRIYSKPIDLAIMNKGGMRRELPVGNVSEGLLGAMFPFDNRLVVLKIKGKDLIDAFSVMASRGGDAVSNGVYVEYDGNNQITKATLHGHKIKDNEIYTLLTLDYLADGGDYMAPLKNAERVATDEEKFGTVVISALKERGKRGEHITASFDSRMNLK